MNTPRGKIILSRCHHILAGHYIVDQNLTIIDTILLVQILSIHIIIMDLFNAPAPALWFEFLLKPEKLHQHLESNSCDPSPTQLINLFLRSAISDHAPDEKTYSLSPSSTLISTTNSIPTNTTPVNSTPATKIKIESDDCKKTSESSGKTPDFSSSLPGLHDPRVNDFPPETFEAEYHLKKCYGLQILAIKVASYLKWDLNMICNNLNTPIQLILMHALIRTCASPNVEAPSGVKNFLGVIYSHWLLRSAINNQISSLQPQSHNTTIIYLSHYQQQQQTTDTNVMNYFKDLLNPTGPELIKWTSFLQTFVTDLSQERESSVGQKRLKTNAHPFDKAKLLRPKMDCFDVDFYGSPHNWSECESVNSRELLEAACYDLGRYYFFKEAYQLSKQSFELISKNSKNVDKYPHLEQYLDSARKLSFGEKEVKNHEVVIKEETLDQTPNSVTNNTIRKQDDVKSQSMLENSTNLKTKETRKRTEEYLFDCMNRFSASSKKVGNNTNEGVQNIKHYLQMGVVVRPLLPDVHRGEMFMTQGDSKEAMACFLSGLILETDYFRKFSKNYQDEEPYITRMIQCSISLSCFTQAVALCQMTKTLNYTIAFKQLNERYCNDCCDDIYECIWNVTLLEYIINMHSRRGEAERRTKVMQLIGQLELNENNPEEILREAEHVRRGKFFRILANKYL